jgi:hypothetical protein
MALQRVAVAAVLVLVSAKTESPGVRAGHEFDFEIGSWRVHHRTLKKHPDGRQEWVEFEGTSRDRSIMDGLANIEENVFFTAGGTRRGVALRSFDPRTGQWAIWWLDERYPLGPVGPPVIGRFENGTGTFYSDELVDGRTIRTRYIWGRSPRPPRAGSKPRRWIRGAAGRRTGSWSSSGRTERRSACRRHARPGALATMLT